jgi:hypothetical protein
MRGEFRGGMSRDAGRVLAVAVAHPDVACVNESEPILRNRWLAQ